MITQNPIEVILTKWERDFIIEAMTLIAWKSDYTVEDFMIKNGNWVDDYVINHYCPDPEAWFDENFQILQNKVAMEVMTQIYHKWILWDDEIINSISWNRIM